MSLKKQLIRKIESKKADISSLHPNKDEDLANWVEENGSQVLLMNLQQCEFETILDDLNMEDAESSFSFNAARKNCINRLVATTLRQEKGWENKARAIAEAIRWLDDPDFESSLDLLRRRESILSKHPLSEEDKAQLKIIAKKIGPSTAYGISKQDVEASDIIRQAAMLLKAETFPVSDRA